MALVNSLIVAIHPLTTSVRTKSQGAGIGQIEGGRCSSRRKMRVSDQRELVATSKPLAVTVRVRCLVTHQTPDGRHGVIAQELIGLV